MADIRALMKQKAAAKRITHQYARYSNAGQLTCTICGVPVKSEVVWPAHLTSKVHRNNVRREREEQEQQQQQQKTVQDHRDLDVDVSRDRKRAAGNDGDDDDVELDVSTSVKRVRFSQDEETSTLPDVPSNNALPPGFFDDPSAEAQASQVITNGQDDDEEWAAFEATLAVPDPPEAAMSALNPFSAGATVSADEVLYEEKDDAPHKANADVDAAEEEEEEPQETEEERKDREEREELMERIETEEREQQEADERVDALKKRMQNLRGSSKISRDDASSGKIASNGVVEMTASAAPRKRRVRGFGFS